MRFQTLILGYFLIGAVMWGGGVLQWHEAGVGQLFIETPASDLEVNEETANSLENSGGAVEEAAKSFGGGGLIAIWNFLMKLLGYLFWPLTVLESVNAPNRITVVAGGGLVVAFVGAFLRLVRQSA